MTLLGVDVGQALGILSGIYGVLTAVVKFFPTLGKGWLLEIIKFLGNITNRQTDDAAIRAAREKIGG